MTKKQNNTFRPAREAWLNSFAKMAQPEFEKHGLKFPALRITTGFISETIYGRTYHKAISSEDIFEIQVCYVEDSMVKIAGTLVHELIHACGIFNHRSDFVAAGKALGLEGKPTMMGWDHGDKKRLPKWAKTITVKLGKYPTGHISIKNLNGALPERPGRPSATPTGDRPVYIGGIVGGKKPQKGRMLKAECEKCNFIFRAARVRLETPRKLRCPDAECNGLITIGQTV